MNYTQWVREAHERGKSSRRDAIKYARGKWKAIRARTARVEISLVRRFSSDGEVVREFHTASLFTDLQRLCLFTNGSCGYRISHME